MLGDVVTLWRGTLLGDVVTSFHHLLLASSVCRPGDVRGRCDVVTRDVVRGRCDEARSLLGLSAFTLFFMMLSHTGSRFVPSSIPVEARVQCSDVNDFLHPSFTLSAVVRISVLSSSTVCSGWSMCICFATSEVVELGLRCSLNLAFSDLSVFSYVRCLTLSTLDIIHRSHHILFINRVLRLHQQLAQRVHRLKVCWDAVYS